MTYPLASMYGVFTYISHKHPPNVGKNTIHGWYGYGLKVVKDLFEKLSRSYTPIFLRPDAMLKSFSNLWWMDPFF